MYMKDLAKRVKKKLPHKQTQEATYFARSILEASESSLLESLLHIVGSKRLYEHDWNVLKIYNDGSRASLLWYPELETVPEPMLCHSLTIDLQTSESRDMSWKKGPVFHRKELLFRKHNPEPEDHSMLVELRQTLHSFQDTPYNRLQLYLDLYARGASEFVWGYVESHVPGLQEWFARQLEIKKKLEMQVYPHFSFNMKNLDGAWLANVEIGGADLRRADLRGADLNCANLVDVYLRGSDFSDANLQGVTFGRSFLNDANLSNADLQNADLSRANLNRSNLQNANLRGADLRFVRAIDTDFGGANYDDETRFPEDFDPESRGMVYDDESQ